MAEQEPPTRKIDLGSLARGAAGAAPVLLHPRDIFNALPGKAAGYDICSRNDRSGARRFGG